MNKINGFTLLELLVVMGIISALAAVAIPQYAKYRERAFDSRAQMDLRSVAIAEEAYFLDSEQYLSCTDNQCADLPGITKLSAGVTLSIQSTSSGFVGTAKHPKGTGRIYRWESNNGGFVGE